MLSAAQQNALSPLAQLFLVRLRAALPGRATEAHTHEGLRVRVEPAAARVGPLEAVIEDDVRLSLGDHADHRVAPELFGDPRDPAAVLTAAETAVEFIADVLADRVVIWSARRGGRVWAGGSYYHGREPHPSRLATEAWLWSGRAVPIAGRPPGSA